MRAGIWGAVLGRGTGMIPLLVVSMCLPDPALAQIYLEPVPTASEVRVDARVLADEDAARALGIPLANEIPSPTHGSGRHVSGARAVLIVLGLFSDSGEPGVTAEQVRTEMFTGADGGSTLADFYEAQSGGAFTVTGEVSEWLRTDITVFEAAGSLNGHGLVGDSVDVHVARLLDQLDPELDFGEFDNDGPDGVPNSGDDDGRVDLLAVKYAEVGGHCGGPGPWPHFGGLRLDGEPYVTEDPTPAGGNVEIPAYLMDSVVECDGATPQSMAITAHELGHAIGLPDYYRAVGGIEPEKRHWAAGCFDLMAAGAWGCGTGEPTFSGSGPAGLSAFSRWTLGWAELQEVTVADDETFVLEPLATSAHALRVRLAPESLESWIIEYRTQEGFDAVLPDEGILIYHRDEYWAPRFADPDLPPPYSYHLVEADGDGALRLVEAEGGNRGVATDYFARTGPAGPLDAGTVPSTRDHLGGASTLTVHEITRTEATATVRLTVGTGLHVASRSIPQNVVVLLPYAAAIELAGGTPPYAITDALGGVPVGLEVAVDGSTLAVAGTPGAAGTFATSVWVTDDAGVTIAEALTIRILDDPAVTAERLLDQVVGSGTLTGAQSDYLDRSGNGDGAVDLGDLRAFVNRQN